MMGVLNWMNFMNCWRQLKPLTEAWLNASMANVQGHPSN